MPDTIDRIALLDVKRLARAMEVSRSAIERADSVGLRYRAIHDDVLCARDEHGCGCLCHAADAIAAEYARLVKDEA
jgi:hypothetical protein